jgi:hypothetical protein
MMTIPIDLTQIVKALNLDVPVYRVQAHDDGIELHLYGGKVVTWNPPNGDPFPVSGDQEITVQHALKKLSDERKPKKRRAKE